MSAPAPRVALCQLRMHWDGDDNTAGVLRHLARAAAQGAQVALFPELALTGIHRGIAGQALPQRVAGWLAQVSQACAAHRIAASVGAPSFAAGGICITQVFFDASGREAGRVHKRGLTAPEATFFVPGHARPTLTLAGWRWSAMICREIDDADAVAQDLAADPPQVLLWPGALRPDPALPRTEVPDHVRRAQALAQRLGAQVLMVNWPNALNRPEESADAGASVVIGADGALRFTLPAAAAGQAVFTLGDEVFDWWPEPA